MSTSTQEPTERLQAILESVRELSAADRARLVGVVLESLDQPDPTIEAEWRDEVERRAAGMDDRSRTATPWHEVRAALGL